PRRTGRPRLGSAPGGPCRAARYGRPTRHRAGPEAPMSLHALLQAFATVFPAELPDKSMVATIVLVTRYRRPALVWVGVVAAFGVHSVVAVAAGSVIGLLPETVVQVVVGV